MMALADRWHRVPVMPLSEEAEAVLALHRDVNRMLDNFIHSFGIGFSFGAPAHVSWSLAWLDAEARRDVKRVPTGDPEALPQRKCHA
jgi:hypothetical protein